MIPQPLDWQDPALYIVGMEADGHLIWCDGTETWTDGEPMNQDEQDELIRRIKEMNSEGE